MRVLRDGSGCPGPYSGDSKAAFSASGKGSMIRDARCRRRNESDVMDTCHSTAKEQWPSHVVLEREKIQNNETILETRLWTKYFIVFCSPSDNKTQRMPVPACSTPPPPKCLSAPATSPVGRPLRGFLSLRHALPAHLLQLGKERPDCPPTFPFSPAQRGSVGQHHPQGSKQREE